MESSALHCYGNESSSQGQIKEKAMTYYDRKTLRVEFDEAVFRVIQAFEEEGFGILT
jgi:uncharacterized protein (DUF302 family)